MYDVIVIGARVAGSPIAMKLAAAGYRVLAVDRSTFPSDTISTHFIWPRGASYLNRWGLLDKVLAVTPSNKEFGLTIEGITIAGSVPLDALRRRFAAVHGDDRGVVQHYVAPRRRVLDQILVNGARAAGAEVREGFSVEEILMKGGRVSGIRGRGKDGVVCEEHAKIVIAADGKNSFLARTMSLPKKNLRSKCTFAYWTYYAGLPEGIPYIYKRGRLAAAHAPTNFGQRMVLVWGPGEWFHGFRGDIAGNFFKIMDVVAPEFAELLRSCGSRQERVYGTIDQLAFRRGSVGPGWALAGDAACFKDQCTAMGITHAFRDAELLGDAVAAGLSGQRSLEEALEDYADRRERDIADYYDFVGVQAESNLPTREDLELLVALQRSRGDCDRFFGAFGDTLPIAEFFTPENLTRLRGTIQVGGAAPAFLSNWASISRDYLSNPFTPSVQNARQSNQMSSIGGAP